MDVLSVLGSAAAISQLLDQAISLVKRIQEAREKVRGASERIDRYKDQLHNLLDTLILVQNERELQTPAIEVATQTIIGTSQELMDHLNVLALRNTKNKAIQYIHVLASGERDENILDDILDRLDRGRAELSVRITTTHVGLSGTIRDGFLAALSIVRRVDENVQRVLGERLVITTRLEGRELPPNGDGRIPLSDEDICALNIHNKVEYIENKAFDDAEMFNTDLVDSPTLNTSARLYKGNQAHGKSLVVQGRADAEGIAAIIRARRG